METKDICEGIVSILSVLADCAKYPELSIILNLILVGATSTGEIENIQIGDHVVVLKVPVESTTDIYMCMCEEVHVFFTESMELKGIIVGI